MSKSSKKQKLTQEEKHEENQNLRKEMSKGYINKEDSQRIVDMLSAQNLIAYAMVLFLPPLGIWYIWTRRGKLHLNDASVYLWTFVGSVILIQYINALVNSLAG